METGYVLMSHILPVRENVPEISSNILLHKIFIKPLGPYWYLHTLIICSLLYYLTFRYTRMKTISQVILFGLGLFTVSRWGGIIVFANAIYFLAGVIIKQSKLPLSVSFSHRFLPLSPWYYSAVFQTIWTEGYWQVSLLLIWLSLYHYMHTIIYPRKSNNALIL